MIGVPKAVRIDLQKYHQQYIQGLVKDAQRERVSNSERPQVTQ